MEYLTVRETANKWNISPRLVQQLCTDGRIPGAQKFGTAWAIPADAEKPQDPRAASKAGGGLRRPAGPHQPDAPDEHPLPAGNVPGGGGGHGGGPSAGHRPGGVLLLHRPAGAGGAGGRSLPRQPGHGGTAVRLPDLRLRQPLPPPDPARPVCSGRDAEIPVGGGGEGPPSAGGGGVCGGHLRRAAPPAPARGPCPPSRSFCPCCPPACGPLPSMSRPTTSI